MAERPNIFPSQWITLGTKKAVVSDVHDGEETAGTVVYLDGRNRPVCAEVHWTEHGWEFVKTAGTRKTTPTDAKGREAVAILRAGLHASPPQAKNTYGPGKVTAIKPSPHR